MKAHWFGRRIILKIVINLPISNKSANTYNQYQVSFVFVVFSSICVRASIPFLGLFIPCAL